MKRFATRLMISAMLVSFGHAQSPAPALSLEPDSTASKNQVSYYSGLNREAIELKAQCDLLSELAQEHKKRAEEPSRDQAARQWETDLVKELEAKSATLLNRLTNLRKERLAFEQTHPELLTGASPKLPNQAPSPYSPDETAYLGKLDERLATVQQEMAETMEAGRVYTAQLATNTASMDFSRITALIQDNGRALNVLQKEAADLELKKLEFRALRRD